MDLTGELHQGGSVVLDASGNGQVIMQPSNAHQRWEVSFVAVSTNQGETALPVPIAELFVNGVQSRGNSRGATWSGNQDSDSLGGSVSVKVGPCDYLTLQFTGGVPGSTGSVVVEGKRFTRRGSM